MGQDVVNAALQKPSGDRARTTHPNLDDVQLVPLDGTAAAVQLRKGVLGGLPAPLVRLTREPCAAIELPVT